MHYAIVAGERTPASPGQSGFCQGCSQPVVARCGEQRVWHWAHKGSRACDDWWEPETEWHRCWKGNFPAAWQEIVYHDQSGEKHIADVRTPTGVVLEFQHSHLKPVEQRARETFYGNLVWVIDGTRLKRDRPRFFKAQFGLDKTIISGVLASHFPEESFPRSWLNSKTIVAFDFDGTPSEGEDYHYRSKLWLLLPGRVADKAVIVPMDRREFVRRANEGEQVMDAQGILQALLTENHRRRVFDAQQLAAERDKRLAMYRHAVQRRRRF